MKTQKRRRKEHKTDYMNRLRLLKSEKPRIVFRKTNKYVIGQYVISKQAQDKIEIGLNSKKLIKYGWLKEFEGSLKSIPATYFTGYLIGKRIIKKKLETPIIDLGMHRTLHKTKIYAFLKGLTDARVKIKCKEENFPSEERIRGEHMKNKISFEEIKFKIDKEN
jgi:large subunit ribosomal protein L18